jgi:hypothetical protein
MRSLLSVGSRGLDHLQGLATNRSTLGRGIWVNPEALWTEVHKLQVDQE